MEPKRKLVSYGGDGYGGYKENAMYEVKYESKEHGKYFNKLSKAIEFYESLHEEKAIWSIDGCPELLNAMYWEEAK